MRLKSVIVFIFAWSAMSVVPCFAIQKGSEQYYVSPRGSDRNDGSIDRPFASPEKALEAIKKAKKIAKKDQPMTIYFREGVYPRVSSLQIEGDIPINFCAYSDEKVVFHGGKKIKGNKFKICNDRSILDRLLPEARGKVVVIDLKKEGITDYGIMKQHGFGSIPEPAPMELFIEGTPQTLARYPNEGILQIGKVYDKGSVPRVGDFSNKGAVFGFEYDRPERWAKATDIWLHGKFSYGYNDDHLAVKQIDLKEKTISIVQPHIYGVLSNIYYTREESAGLSVRGYYAYNLLEEIDRPGEYYLDRKTGKLYLYPTESLENALIEVSLLEDPFIKIKNATNVRIEGITFTCARGMGIYLEDAKDVAIDGCTFSNLGTVAVSMGRTLQKSKLEYFADGAPNAEVKISDDFQSIAISNCSIYNTGTGGIIASGGDRKKLISGNNSIENCEFHHTDRINETYSPSIKLFGVGARVKNCSFYDLKHQAISFMGNDHVIEYCRFDRVCTDADDMGAIYTGRDPSSRGTVIRYNYFSNIQPKDKNTSMCGVYVDDGSGGIIIDNNFFYRVGNQGHYKSFAAVYVHGGHDNRIVNNTFMDCMIAVGHNAWDNERWENFLQGPLQIERLTQDVNITDSVYLKKYPELKNYFTEIGRRLNFVRENIYIRSQSVYNGDLFYRRNVCYDTPTADPEKLNYEEIKEAAGFTHPFPFEKTGVIKNSRKK